MTNALAPANRLGKHEALAVATRIIVEAATLARLRAILTNVGLSQRALSKKAGLSPSFVESVLSGRSQNPTAENLSRVAVAAGFNPAWLVYGQEPRQLPATGLRHEALRRVLDAHPGRWPNHVILFGLEWADQAQLSDDAWINLLDRVNLAVELATGAPIERTPLALPEAPAPKATTVRARRR